LQRLGEASFDMNSLSKIIGQCFPIVFLAPLMVLLSGCGTTPYAYEPSSSTNDAPAINGTPVSVPPSAAGSQTNPGSPDTLRAGDRINVTFSGLPGTPIEKHEEQIREDGYINPPFLGRSIKAAGKRIGQLQEELQKLYVPDYFKSATITVGRQDSYYFVGGEVKNGGQKPYLSEMTVLKAVQAAGDFTDFSKKTKVQVIRANGHMEKPVNCPKAIKNPKLDLPIFPGDQIIVPKRRF
jgi:protein involved in polysaccharide export with SLBB domain